MNQEPDSTPIEHRENCPFCDESFDFPLGEKYPLTRISDHLNHSHYWLVEEIAVARPGSGSWLNMSREGILDTLNWAIETGRLEEFILLNAMRNVAI